MSNPMWIGPAQWATRLWPRNTGAGISGLPQGGGGGLMVT